MNSPFATSALNRPRSPRGRVLVVGSDGDVEMLNRCLPRPPLQASNLFNAIGEVTIAPAGEPITIAMISADRLDERISRAAEAMRRVDPSLRVVLVTRSTQPPPRHELVGRGFDGWLCSPLQMDDVQRVLSEDGTALEMINHAANGTVPAPIPPKVPGAAASPPPAMHSLPISQPATTESTMESSQRITSRSDDDQAVADELWPHASGAAPAAGAGASSVEKAPSSSAELPVFETETRAESAAAATESDALGDTDLVEALLHNPTGVRQLALGLIAQHTHWDDLALSETPPAAPPPSQATPTFAAVEVAFAERRFGWLSSSRATTEQLAAWSAWLGRWLALDQSYHTFRLMAYQDDLTGAWNRRFFDAFIRDAIASAAPLRRPVTVMVFDIDNFKSYNDHYGHDAGDEILRETVRLLNSVIRQGDRVCRIGGDEFAVVFADVEAPRHPGSHHPETIDVIARRFQEQICTMRFPKLAGEAPGTLTISGGLATYPWDGSDPETLLRHADQLALESKRKGKNVVTLGPGAAAMCKQDSSKSDQPPQ